MRPYTLSALRSVKRSVQRTGLGAELGGISGSLARLEALALVKGLGVQHVVVGSRQRLDRRAVDHAAVEMAVVLGGHRPRDACRGGVAGEDPTKAGQRLAQLVAMHDHVDHPMRKQVLCLLEALRQLLANGLLNDAWTGEADERA